MITIKNIFVVAIAEDLNDKDPNVANDFIKMVFPGFDQTAITALDFEDRLYNHLVRNYKTPESFENVAKRIQGAPGFSGLATHIGTTLEEAFKNNTSEGLAGIVAGILTLGTAKATRNLNLAVNSTIIPRPIIQIQNETKN